MYQALRSLGVESQLVIYPGEHHGLTRPSFLADRLSRYIAWYGTPPRREVRRPRDHVLTSPRGYIGSMKIVE